MDCIVHGVTKSWTQLSDFPVSLSYIKQITNKNLLYNTGKSIQYSDLYGKIALKKKE